jgi:hypothetical protein
MFSKYFEQLDNEGAMKIFDNYCNEICSAGTPIDLDDNRWRPFQSAFFAITVFTSIGYGFTAPLTSWGKVLVNICVIFCHQI